MAKLSLKRRERAVVLIGLVSLLFIGLTPVARNFNSDYERSASLLGQAEKRLKFAKDLRRAIEGDRSGQNAITERLLARKPRFDLWSFTTNCLRTLSLESRAELQSKRMFATGNIAGIQLTLRGVSMQELVSLFHSVYSSQNLIVVQRLDYLRPARDGKGLDCLVTFITPKA